MKREHAAIAANSTVLAAAIAIAFRFSGAYGAALCAIAGVPMMIAVSLSEFVLYKKADYSSECEAMLFALQQMHASVRHSGKSFLAGMRDCLASLDRNACAKVYDLLYGIYKKSLLGAQLDEAVSSTCTGEGPACAALRNVGKEYASGRDPSIAVKNAYDRLCRTVRRENAENAGKLQRYLTVSMALGTVLPSFAVFAFTGYSMVYYSQRMFSLFCVAMLILMPNI